MLRRIQRNNSRTKNTILNLLSGVVGEFIIYVLSFVTRTIFIQTLGRNYLGIGGLFTNILAMLQLTDLGIGIAMNYRLYKPLKEKNEHRLCLLMKFYKKMYMLIGTVILVLGCLILPFLQYLIKDFSIFYELELNPYLVFVLYLCQTVSTYWFFAYRSAIVKADQKEYYLNVVGYIITFITNILQIIVLLATKDYLLYLIVVIVMNIIQGFVNAKIADSLYSFLKKKCTDSLSKEEALDIFKDCSAISLFSISNEVLKSTDNLVLSAFIGLDIVGLYSNYLMVYNALKKVMKRLIRSAQASLGNLFADLFDEIRYNFFRQMNCFMVLVCGTCSVCVAVLADEFITTWIGAEYVIAMPFSILVALELYTIGLKLILEQMRDVMGLFKNVKWRPILSIIINIVASILLVRPYGIYGVIIATLISEWTTTLLVDPRMIFKYGFHNYKHVSRFYLENGIYIIELFLIGFVNFWITKNVCVGYGWFSFIIHGLISFVFTFVFIALVNIRNSAMRKLLKRGLILVKNVGKKIESRWYK